MRNVILSDKLCEVLRKKKENAKDMLCSEEYRAGYVEAINQILLYMPWLYCIRQNYPRK